MIFEKRTHHILELAYNKWSPFIISVIIVVYHVLNFLTQIDFEWIEYFFFPSLLTAMHMYNSRNIFMLCKVHRCFVNYVVANVLICIMEHYWINPYMNIGWFTFLMVGTICVLLLALFYSTQGNLLKN